jgi:hypothetical protein
MKTQTCLETVQQDKAVNPIDRKKVDIDQLQQ